MLDTFYSNNNILLFFDSHYYKFTGIIPSERICAIRVARKIRSQDVIDELFKLFIWRGIPEHIRSDNGPEFTAKAVRKWLSRLGVKTLFIEKGSPWENGYIESFNGKMRDERYLRHWKKLKY
jgi:transposase InsO family protein